MRPPLLDTKLSKAFSGLAAESPEELYRGVCRHWTVPPLNHRSRPTSASSSAGLATADDLTFTEQMMAADTLGLLPDEILTKADRAGMAIGLETRAPFLSTEVVQLAWSLPLDLKIRKGLSKWPLRRILSTSLPKSLINRPKAGFGLPIDSWLRGPLRGWAEELLNDRETLGIIDHAVVQRSWSQHVSGTRNAAYELWDVLMLADWCRRRQITLS